MKLSYWELKSWFTNIDYTIVGSGIVGLNAALRLRERFPSSKILILEKGTLPQGASTKNAGFASFGSLSEILEDLKTHTQEEVQQLIQKRWQGLDLLKKKLGEKQINFQANGGYELFLKSNEIFYNECLDKLDFVNKILNPIFKTNVFIKKTDNFGFKKTHNQLIFNSFEGSIDTGNMMQNLLKLAISKDILILNKQTVNSYQDIENGVEIELTNFSFKSKKLLFATNGFANSLSKGAVIPARAQVLITKPIKNLAIKGTFHIDRGFYYFRNIDNRILIGGGRNLDFKNETTTNFGETQIIQDKLEYLLKEVILTNHTFKIEHRWSGIMGMGKSKKPIISQLSNNVFCGIRLGGMGIAIGCLIGQELADLI